MRLISVSVRGIRRFQERSTVRLNGQLVSFIGPNEAGKSSLLYALTLLNDDDPIPDRDVTRGTDPEEAEVKASFVLNDGDRRQLEDVPAGAAIERCTVIKAIDGYVRVGMDPRPPHDMTLRAEVRKSLEGLEQFQALRNANGNKPYTYSHDQLQQVRKALSGKHFLGMPQVKALRTLGDGIEQAVAQWRSIEDETQRLDELPQRMRELADHEEHPAPEAAAAILRDLRPEFLLFGDEERDLRTQYGIRGAAASPPPALRNLVSLAGLDLAQVVAAIDRDRPSDFEPLLNRANRQLAEQFSAAWVREQVTPYLHVYNDELHLSVIDFDGEGMSPIDERSDGLRWFIAMLSFVSTRGNQRTRPVLLVDEAETHLSYDAQANLVQVLSNQQVAQMVLYTTHSAGCLPSDLGTGVKPLVPSETEDRSAILNSFWQQDPTKPGFTSLMLAMGASALAFTPARNVVVGEGPSECLLLPTLLREVVGTPALDFQVAPGLSNASEASFPTLLDSGARVVFLCDADKGGRDRADWLRRAGADERTVITYDDGHVRLDAVAIEDLLRPEVYAEAVNRVLSTYAITDKRLDASKLDARDRSGWLRKWLNRRHIDPRRVQKPMVCQEAVAQAVDDRGQSVPIVADEHREALARLHTRIVAGFTVSVRPVGTGGS